MLLYLTCWYFFTFSIRSVSKRRQKQLQQTSAMLCGLVTAMDYESGLHLISEKDFGEHEAFFQDIFEIGRRHKIMNPEKMRTEYGKLVYLMQDACSPHISKLIGGEGRPLQISRNIKSVYSFLEEKGGLAILEDPNIELATREVLSDRRSRAEIQNHIKKKEQAVAYIKRKYCSAQLSQVPVTFPDVDRML
jgi:hypothetical protein